MNYKPMRDLTVHMTKDVIGQVLKDSSLMPSLIYDVPIGTESVTDEFKGGTRVMPDAIRQALLDHHKEDHPKWTHIQWKEWDKLWEGRTLATSFVSEKAFYVMDNETIMSYFYEKLKEHAHHGSNFYVLSLQGWITDFVLESQKYEKISDMPLDDRSMGIIMMDTVKGEDDVCNLQYAPVNQTHFSLKGGTPHEGVDGKECTCEGSAEIGKWRKANLPHDHDKKGVSIAW